MLRFKKVEKKHLKSIQKYLKYNHYELCDASIGVMFMWEEYYNFYYAVYKETLILKSVSKKGKQRFFPPIGLNKEEAYKQLEEYAIKNCIQLEFVCIDESELEHLKQKYEGLTYTFNRDFSDYIYRYSDIEFFVGKKFSGQRNHINAFKKAYPNYKYRTLTNKNVGKILDFLKEYENEHKDMGEIEKKEFSNTLMLINNLSIAKFVGGYITVKGKIVAFSIGEYVGKTLVIHVEKASREYRGVYPTMFNELVKHAKKEGVEFINREDDSGDLGLRTSKTQYQPIKISNKYHVVIKKPMNVKKIPTLKGDGIVLSSIKKSDVNDYYKLSTAVKNNSYWGYNYKKDIKGESKEEFYNMAKRDFNNGDNAVFIIRQKNQFLGEVILHNFSYDGQVEIGIRLIKKAQGKGIASKALKKITNYVLNELKKEPYAKCYIQNEASKKLFLKNGYKITNQDKKFIYFNY